MIFFRVKLGRVDLKKLEKIFADQVFTVLEFLDDPFFRGIGSTFVKGRLGTREIWRENEDEEGGHHEFEIHP